MLIDDLPALATFARIVAAGSLSAAARELDLSLSVVSKRLAQLETRLGVRLLQRTTRQQTLTDEGALFHAQVVRILAEIEQAESLMRERRGTVSGALRITAPGELGRRRIAFRMTVRLGRIDRIVVILDGIGRHVFRVGDRRIRPMEQHVWMHSGSSIELQLRTGAARTPVSISQAPCPSARSRIAHGS